MRIGIDMRMAGSGEGIGRYCEELVKHLGEIDRENEYYLICNDNRLSIINNQFKIIRVKSKYYSLMEQAYFIYELSKLNVDLMHFTNFNMPVFYPGKFVVTIHDLIHHQFPGRKKSRYLHRLAYRTVIWTAVHRAEKIIAVSEATKQEIIKTFGVDPDKVQVIYESASEHAASSIENTSILKKYSISKPFVLSVGVWRQYKNIPALARSFDIIKERYNIDCQLVFAGKIDPFYPEIQEAALRIKNSGDIRALGFVPDEDLSTLYRNAKLFVLPSLTEGFGLIGIEAQSAGLAVAASDIPVLREVLGNGAVFFNPKDEQDMAEKIAGLWNDGAARQSLIASGSENIKRFDWKKAAKETLNVYTSP